jgi:arylsulfatase A-like enzyme
VTTRWSWLAFAAVLPIAAQEHQAPPNIVLIVADDLGWGDLGCYGNTKVPTPNLDRLAVEGVRFTQCYAGSTVCAPSRCALLTGRHTGHCTIRGNKRIDLGESDVTIAEVLREAGYATVAIGKWGLGTEGNAGIPTRQGFDAFFGYLDQRHAHNYYPSWLWRDEARAPLRNEARGGIATKKLDYSHDLFTQQALAAIEKHRECPFFLYLAYTVPHANNELGNATGDGMEVPDWGPFAAEAWPEPDKGRAAMVHRLDQDVGRLLARLDELELAAHTLVLFTSDNGPHREGGSDPDFFGARGVLRGYKRDLYEGGIRVPMLARWPGTIPANATSNHVWALWDLLPTLAEIAGVAAPSDLDGRSVLPALRGREAQPAEFLYWEFHEGGFHQAVRTGRWKALRHGLDAPLELYDLEDDLGETRDVAARRPEVVARIEEYLKGARTESAEFPVR